MSRNPYFAHLPSRRNRQDLVFALDSLPRLLTSTSTSSSTYDNDTQSSSYPSPPGSPCSPYATFTGSYHPSWSTISTSSSTSSTSSTSSCSSISSFYQQQYQHRLIQRHIRRSYPSSPTPKSMSTLQFSTRAQAMGFLINLLQSFQQEPCECDLVQGCFCSPEGVEDHSGMAPCYVCGEWYAEEVYCTGGGDDQDSSYRRVDGRSWHERGGASLRHQVAERRVQQWLDQVVVPVASAATWSSSPYYYQQQQQQQPHPHHSQHNKEQEQQQEQQQSQSTPTATGIRSRPGRSASCPATFSIPEEIMDPSIRSPGFRIKRRDTIATERPASFPSPVEKQVPAPTSYSAPSSASSTLVNNNNSMSTTPFFRFSFTSERFNAAIQESLSRRSSPTSSSSSSTAVVPQQPSPSANNNTTVDSQAEAVAEQTEAEPGMAVETESTVTETEEAVTVTVAETETALNSAQSTPFSPSSFVSSPSSHSRGCSPHFSAGKANRNDQYGVAEEAATDAAVIVSTVAQQPFSCTTTSLSSSTCVSKRTSTSTSTSTGTGTGTGTTFSASSTFSFGKPQLDSPLQASVIPSNAATPQGQQQQQSPEAGRGRVRRRGHGHVRQLAQSNILVTGSSFHQPLSPQPQPQQAEIGETSGPVSMMVMPPPSASSSYSLPSSASSSATPRSARSQHGVSSPPLTTAAPPSIIKKKKKEKTVSFALPLHLPLPRIVITPPEKENAEETVAEGRSCCDTPSSSPNAITNNFDNPLVASPRESTIQSIPIHSIRLPSSSASTSTLTRLVQQALQSAITLGWWSYTSLGAGLLFFTFPAVTPSSSCT